MWNQQWYNGLMEMKPGYGIHKPHHLGVGKEGRIGNRDHYNISLILLEPINNTIPRHCFLVVELALLIQQNLASEENILTHKFKTLLSSIEFTWNMTTPTDD